MIRLGIINHHSNIYLFVPLEVQHHLDKHHPIVVSVLTTVSSITHSLSIAAIAIMPVT